MMCSIYYLQIHPTEHNVCDRAVVKKPPHLLVVLVSVHIATRQMACFYEILNRSIIIN